MCTRVGCVIHRDHYLEEVRRLMWYCVVEQYRMVVLGYWKKKKQKQSKAKARIPFLNLKEKLQRVQSRAETGSHR